jgi:amino acid adenylation domain-containing protein/non-ribosomal peptide synthase protein (TIGR01720 family)
MSKKIVPGKLQLPKANYPKQETLHALFTKQAVKTPNNIAVIFESQHLTYHELDARSTQLARLILANNPTPLIAIYLERSLETILSILAVLKAGCAYIPIDPSYPEERIKFMLEDSQTSLVLSQRHLDLFASHVTRINIDDNTYLKQSHAPIKYTTHPNDLAYVIYTSGTTGAPKGVMIEHLSVVNLINNQCDILGIDENSHVLQFSSYVFDASVEEIFITLLRGASLYIPTETTRKNGVDLSNFINNNMIDVAILPASILRGLTANNFTTLSTLKLCGEVCSHEKIVEWQVGRKLLNGYGPTEAAVCASTKLIQKDDNPNNIGKPNKNVKIYILDTSQNPVAIGEEGELYITGAGIARGYLNQPELTKEHFINNPFMTKHDRENGYTRLYKTGDLACYLPDGNISYLGRYDFQVKIRGHRIELGEIEKIVAQYPDITQSIVLSLPEKKSFIVAYYTTTKNINITALRKHLTRYLPNYMIPSAFIAINQIPLTIHGKVDRKALPPPEYEDATYTPPSNEIETAMVDIWKEVLGIDRVGIHDDFFKLGGDSIQSIQISFHMQSLGLNSQGVKDLSTYRTIHKLGQALGTKKVEKKHTSSKSKTLSTDASTVDIHKKLLDKIRAQDPEAEAVYPANSLQQGFIYHSLSQPYDEAYRVQLLLDYHTEIDTKLYEKAWELTVFQFPSLRTYFNWDEEVIQIIRRKGKLQFTTHEGVEVDTVQMQDLNLAFDLKQPTLLRINLLKHSKNHYTLIATIHHIITDGWSMSILFNRMHENYYELSKGNALNRQKDNAYLQAQAYIEQHQKKAKAYWDNHLKTVISANDLNPLLSKKTHLNEERVIKHSEERVYLLESSDYQTLKNLSKSEGITINTLLQFAWHKLLQTYTQDNTTIVGTVLSGRALPIPGIEKSIGLYINTLPLVMEWNNQVAVREQLHTLSQSIQHANEYSYAHLANLQQQGERLFHSLLVFQNYPVTKAANHCMTPTLRSMVMKLDYPLSLIASEEQGSMRINIKYDADLLTQIKADALIQNIMQILKQIPNKLDEPHHAISLVSKKDYQTLIYDWNQTDTLYPKHKTLHALFSEQAIKTPNNLAVIFESQRLTYRELNERSDQLARLIIANNPTPLIAVCLERSLELIIAIVAILKSGCAYVPIDSNYPKERTKFIIKDGEIGIILTQSHLSLPDIVCTRINIDNELDCKQQLTQLKNTSQPESLAYVMYTSGTTGVPKGVMVEHQNIVSLLTGIQGKYFDAHTIINTYSITNYAFDIFIAEYGLPLLSGGTIELGNTDFSSLDCSQYSFIQMTPSMWSTKIETLTHTSNTKLFITGEALTPYLFEKLKSLEYEFINLYGPTETTVWATASAYKSNSTAPLSIGSPLFNQRSFILDSQLKPVPIGAIGELYIGGTGVARGYLNQPKLTQKHFIPNPFATPEEIKCKLTRMYKTGDVARHASDGSIEYIGRNDSQIKIRGFRIELGEIEHVLSEYPGITQYAVFSYSKPKPFLSAYYVATSLLDKNSVQKHLEFYLPDYMIPRAFIQLEQFPLTHTGKIDRNALPTPEFIRNTYVPPRNKTETQIAQIWKEILHVDKVGIQDDFFRLGGDSIQNIQATTRMQRAGFPYRVKDIFKHRTIERLLEASIQHNTISTEQGLLTGSFALLPIQSWFFKQHFSNIHHWNQSFLIKVPKLNIQKMNQILPILAAHHDMLRVHFTKDYQAYLPNIDVPKIKTYNIKTLLKTQLTKLQSHFNIYTGPLWNIAYIEGYTDGSARLHCAFHHLIIDTVSWRVLADDMKRLYEGEELDKKHSSYRQWVAECPKNQDFWKNQTIPQKAPKLLKKASYHTINLSKAITQHILTQANDAYHTEINDLLLTALTLALSDWLGYPEHAITLEAHGREDVMALDVGQTVGWFTSIMPIRLKKHATIRQSIIFTKNNLRSFPNKGLGFSDFGKLPKVSFNYLGQFDQHHEYWQITHEFAGTSVHPKNKKPHVLHVNAITINEQLHFNISSYAENAQKFVTYFQTHLQKLVKHCLQQKPTFTPSDFPTINISQTLLDRLQQTYEIVTIHPANSLQQGFIYHTLSQNNDDAYRIQAVLDYHNSLDIELYKKAWCSVIEQYPILRTCFNWDEEIIQITCKTGRLSFNLHTNQTIKNVQQQDRQTPFDLTQPTLLRLNLIKHSDTHYTLLKTQHHSITDGWSNPILLQQVHKHYETLINKKPLHIKPETTYLRAQDYIAAHQVTANQYWKHHLRHIEFANDLNPMFSKRVNLSALRNVEHAEEVEITLQNQAYLNIKNFSKEKTITTNTIIQFAWHKLIQSYTQDNKTIVGTTISGRTLPITGIEQSVGVYINTLPLMMDWQTESTIYKQLNQLGTSINDLNEYSYANLATLSQQGERLFHSILIFENYPQLPKSKNNLINMQLQCVIEKLDYPLGITIYEQHHMLRINLKYDCAILDKNKSTKLLKQLALILEQIPNIYHEPHYNLNLLTQEEYQQVIYTWNQTDKYYPSNRTVCELFTEQAKQSQHKLALTFANHTLSYQELDERSNQLARLIRNHHPSKLIVLILERSLEMIIAVLAVFKTGCAYVPVEPDTPTERLKFILNDTETNLILTQSSVKLPSISITQLHLDQSIYLSQSNKPIQTDLKPNDLAYVIYTSGTTGEPKGVMIEHAGFVNRVFAERDQLNLLNSHDKIIHVSPYSLDMFCMDYALAWCLGCELHILPRDTIQDIQLLAQYIFKQQITYADLPTALYQMLDLTDVRHLASLKYLRCGGEKLTKVIHNHAQDFIFINEYGPSETTIDSHWAIYQSNADHRYINPSVIGKAINNIKTYVLDSHMHPVPIDAIGELYIGGSGLARGYLNQPTLTKEKFITNPFIKHHDAKKERSRLYKTGDLVRYLADGTLEYIGRNDFQIKIRGFRIELGEIEKVLAQYSDIEQCVVGVFKEPTIYLTAYYVASINIDSLLIIKYLKKHLPDYMIPKACLQLDALPMTANGKLDRKSLPIPALKNNTYVAPRNEIEAQMLHIWKSILCVENIGIMDDFFQLGGHSILAIQSSHKISKQLNKHISVKDIFQKRTIFELSSLLHHGKALKNIERTSGLCVLSYAQERLWFIEQYEGGSDAYHIPMVYELADTINLSQLELALQQLITRHAILRTVLTISDTGEYLQETRDDKLNIQNKTVNDSEYKKSLHQLIHTPYDLTQEYPIRVCLYTMKKTHVNILAIVVHHMAFDEWSDKIFHQELQDLYNKKSLPALSIQYRDFAVWQKKYLLKQIKKSTSYWKKYLSNAEPLNFPTDYQRPKEQHYNGNRITFTLPNGIIELAKTQSTSLYAALLTTVGLLLSRYTGEKDILIGSPISNRAHPQLSQLIGFFVNTVALRLNINQKNTFSQTAEQIQKTLVATQTHQEAPFEHVIDALNLERDSSRHPLFQILFNLSYEDDLTNNNMFTPIEHDYVKAKFDLLFHFIIRKNTILVAINYATSLFKQSTITRIASHLQQLMTEIQKVDKPLYQYHMLQPEEYHQIVYDWNKKETPYPKNKTIHELFTAQAKHTPLNIALIFEEQCLTYQEVDALSNQLAHELLNKNPCPLIPLCLERSFEMIIAILAVLKAGLAYVPLAPSDPQKRIEFMLLDINANLILTQKHLKLPKLALTRINLDEKSYVKHSKLSPNIPSKPTDLAYVIYTSGTTGQPKGVMVEHGSVVNRVNYMQRFAEITAQDRYIFKINYCFDASVADIFTHLATGATLRITKHIFLISELEQILKEEYNAIHLVPSQYEYIAKKLLNSTITKVYFSGESLSPSIVLNLKQKKNIKVYNYYGPTEAGDIICFQPDNTLDKNIIGHVFPNNTTYVLDDFYRPVPIGVTGQLYIGGICLARGYLNKPKLTKEKFIVNPFTLESEKQTNYTKLYKTGDLVRYLPDGAIEYIGRTDFQIKIRGIRIELREIESILSKYSGIKQSVVLSHQEPHPYLAAYYVSDHTIDISLLRKYLSTHLAEYMIPSSYIQLKELPLTTNGKLDSNALPSPQLQKNTYLPPRNEIEQKTAKIWTKTLKIKHIGIEDDFFHLGGHSILAMQVSHLMSQMLNKNITVKDIFEQRTISELSRLTSQEKTLEIIQPAKKPGALSYAQERLWFIEQYEDGSDAYHIPMIYKLHAKTNLTQLESAIQNIIKRHTILRTVFTLDKHGQYLQTICAKNISLHEKKLTYKSYQRALHKLIHTPYDLTKEYPIRLALYTIKETKERIMVVVVHHIAFDEWSEKIFYQELHDFYDNKNIPPLMIQYQDFAAWQRNHSPIKMQEGLNYWTNALQDINTLYLPADYPRPNVLVYHGNCVTFKLPKAIITRAKAQNTTVYTLLLTIVGLLLSRYSGQTDILIGSPISNRTHPQLAQLIGFFVNTLVLRLKLNPEATFTETLEQTYQILIAAQTHQEVPFERIVAELKPQRDPSRHPLFQVLFNVSHKETSFCSDILTPMSCDYQTSKFDLQFHFSVINNEVSGLIVYATSLFKHATITRIATNLKHLVAEVLKADKPLHTYQIISKKEYQQTVIDWNTTDTPDPNNKKIHELFSEQAKRVPNHIAVVFEKQSLSYQALDERSNQLAREITQHGPSTLIALCLERGIEVIVAILAVLKSGCAYVPIDPDFPTKRRHFILEDSGTTLLITQKHIKLRAGHIACIYLDDQTYLKQCCIPLNKTVKPQDLAYVIYTSGTTGKPKGVMVEHDMVTNFSREICNHIVLNENTKTTIFSTFVFDISIFECFTALLQGAESHILSDDVKKDIRSLTNYLLTHDITCSYLPPAILALLPRIDFPKLNMIMYAGESCNIDASNYWSKKVRLYNYYGPTETNLATKAHVQTCNSNNIGKPIRNTKVYVLDSEQNPVPIGAIGELYIGGRALARGYLNLPELTKTRFVKNTFATEQDKKRKYTHLYKTGDLVRWLENGDLEYLGRNDFQVKIRGYRIELSEIEHALITYPEITQCAVFKQTKQPHLNAIYLVGYYLSQHPINHDVLRKHLATSLPDYMIPNTFMHMSALPLTINGKIDQNLLPIPDFQQEAYTPPRDEAEKVLWNIWSRLLHVDRIGIDDDFFEIGGHSILAIQAGHQFSQSLNKEILVRDFFQHKTIRRICSALYQSKDLPVIKPGPTPAPLSFAQERMVFLEQYERGSDTYHIPMLYELTESINIEQLKSALKQLVSRHAILRTILTQDVNGHYFQKPLNQELPIDEQTLISSDVKKVLQGKIHDPFDLLKEYPIRVGIYTIQHTQKTFLSITIHHIAFDGWSMNIFIQELNALYERKSLAPLTIQYKDFAVWQREYFKTNLQESIDYWKNQLHHIPNLNLATDYPRPKELTYHGDTVTFTLPDELNAKLKTLAHTQGITIYSILLTTIGVLLSRYTQQEDFILGTFVANRQHPQTSHLIGCFVNTLALHLHINNQKTFLENITETHRMFMAAQWHQDVPFEQLIDLLNIERDTSRHPLFQILFNVTHDDEKKDFALGKLINAQHNIAKFDLEFQFNTTHKTINGSITYAKSLFKKTTVTKIATYFQYTLTKLFESNHSLITYTMLLPEERKNIMYDWNTSDVKFIKNKTLNYLFEQQVKKTPSNTAIVFENKNLTYQQLNQLSNQVARSIRKNYLLNQGHTLKPDTLIVICFERSAETLIAMLGILKSGAAYVPVSASYPKKRIEHILKDTKAPFTLTQSCFRKLFKQCIFLDKKDYQNESSENLSPYNTTSNLAYVIYTSGTTGTPKGVMISHDSYINFICSTKKKFTNLTKQEKIGQINTITFDVAMLDIALALINGYELHILPDTVRTDINLLSQYVAQHKLTYIHLPTVLYECFQPSHIRQFESLRYLVVGGERLSRIINNEGLDYVFVNAYGPTECTIYTSFAIYENKSQQLELEINNIGKPIDNMRMYVLDKHLRLLPIGVIGELYIGGAGLARGYLNQQELTDKRFIQNPFATKKDILLGYTKLYQTGDLVRWLPNGSIEFFGRNDFQVKIRGFRIELGEIETILSQVPSINRCVVMNFSEPSPHLVAYYVASKQLKESALRQYLANLLPDYMLPSTFIQLDQLPRTSNDKIDRKALPMPIVEHKQLIPPRNELESKLVRIWETALQMSNISIMDDFFKLGGNSILAIQITYQMNHMLNTQFNIADIFHHRSIDKLAQTMLLEKKESRLLQPLSSSNKKNHDLYFVHPGYFGSTEVYQPLINDLKQKFNLFGFEHYYFMDDALHFNSMHHLADHYLNKLAIENLTSKPIILCGWSWGGEIAISMAQLLEQKGHDKIYLFLLDTHTQITSKKQSISQQAQEKKYLSIDLHEKGLPEPEIIKRLSFVDTLSTLRNNHEIKKLKRSEVILFKATREDKGHKQHVEHDNNLQQFFDKKITLIPVDSTHMNIIKESEKVCKIILDYNF